MPPQRPRPRKERSEEDQWSALKPYMVKGEVTKARMATFRAGATNKTGWSTKRLDAWLAKLAEQKKIRTPTFRLQAQRDGARAKGEGPPREREQGQLREKVRAWVADRTEGHVTAAHLCQMKENLKRGVSATGVEAMVVEMEDNGEITLEDRVRGKGGRPRPRWREEARGWARERGWKQTPTLPTTGPSRGPPKEQVAVEFGTGWEGATEGMRRVWDRVITVDLKRQTLVHRGAKSTPDFLTTFEQAANHQQGAAIWAAKKAGARKGELAAIWASIDCTYWTTAQGFQKGAPGQGTFGDRNIVTLTLTLGPPLPRGAQHTTRKPEGTQQGGGARE